MMEQGAGTGPKQNLKHEHTVLVAIGTTTQGGNDDQCFLYIIVLLGFDLFAHFPHFLLWIALS